MSVVISGIGIISAIGNDARSNAGALLGCRDGIGPIRNFATAHNVPAGEVGLSNDDLKQMLGLDPRKTISRTALLGMAAAAEAIADAQIDTADAALVSATTVGGMDLTPLFYKDFLVDANSGRLRYVIWHDCAASTMAIADYCHLDGYATAISTACSSSANAIIHGVRLIESGLADTVVAGGTDALCAYTLNGFMSLQILSASKCRPFDADREGLNLGEGAAYVVLQRQESAQKAYCRVAGYANANDAYHQTAISADAVGPQKAMAEALAHAHISPSDIDYINTHGTATPNNDTAEIHAISAIWGDAIPSFGSTKAFTGHTLAAAGSIEAVYCILAMRHGMVWPNLNFQSPIDGNAAFTPATSPTAKPIRTVMNNSFGFGGNCTTLILQKL